MCDVSPHYLCQVLVIQAARFVNKQCAGRDPGATFLFVKEEKKKNTIYVGYLKLIIVKLV